MIKIEAPEAYELVGLKLAQDARHKFPNQKLGRRNCIVYTKTIFGLTHSWAVWRTKSGWVARWLGYEGDK